MKRLLIAAPFILAMAESIQAVHAESVAPDRVTYYKNVMPIMQSECMTCHRPGGSNLGGVVAPMSLTTYEETRPWVKSIAEKVAAREMPPWHAAPAFSGVFKNERRLTDAEIETILRWVKDGAPAGDKAHAPERLQFGQPDGWSIGEPDLVIRMDEPYLVADDVEDEYAYFQTQLSDEDLPEDRWIKAVEYRPGSRVVHHIVAQPIGGTAPGISSVTHEDGYGRLLKNGTRVIWQMHYHKESGPGTAVWDQSEIAFRFYPAGEAPEHPILSQDMGEFGFRVPAGDPSYSATVQYTFDRDSRILSFTPHMHLRGKSAKYVATYPDGSSEVLLEVPHYEHHWQTTYDYIEPKPVRAGTTITYTAVWDNSASNPLNPDPTIDAVFGLPTTSEMMFGFMTYVDEEPGYNPPSNSIFHRMGQGF